VGVKIYGVGNGYTIAQHDLVPLGTVVCSGFGFVQPVIKFYMWKD